ncbi:iron-containing alcohol dehydrogenase [Hydrogenophaga sp.]|uniref:iron-containing alcohol dehydrogenase n=1 Tax=Hydrogenophaga sp. TaxID=1904254 RepID=UPI002607F1A6|nr:iron-containing alcohol dehydrogenase [Hydrogenophaga sp.]MCW5654026.1 iron-containing alcohol dehydrogenase [Hydrogenophaga sp.]
MSLEPGRAVHAQSATERIYVGEPVATALTHELESTGRRRAFIVCSRTLATATPAVAALQQALGERHVGTFHEVPPHSSRAAVLAVAAQARAAGADALVAIGGGSIIDTTKVVALCLKHGLTTHEGMDAYRVQVDPQGQRLPPAFEGPDVPVIAVPTTLSGAEFYETGGITNERECRKQSFGHRRMVPRAIILDPAITLHTPHWLWISTGVRAIDHAVETLGSLRSNAYGDALAESALRTLVEALPRSHVQPHDLAARGRCMTATWQSMTPLAAGIPMGISHATGHVLGGSFGVSHGHTSCVVAPSSLAFNQGFNGERQLRISASLGDAHAPASALLDRLIRSLGMPRSLAEVGFDRRDIPRLAEGVMQDRWTATNPRPIENVQQMIAFLETLP